MYYIVIRSHAVGDVWLIKAESSQRAKTMLGLKDEDCRCFCVTTSDLLCLQGNKEVLIRF